MTFHLPPQFSHSHNVEGYINSEVHVTDVKYVWRYTLSRYCTNLLITPAVLVTHSHVVRALSQIKNSFTFLQRLLFFKPYANLFLMYTTETLLTPYKGFALQGQSRHRHNYRISYHFHKTICYLSDRKWIGGVLTNWKYLRKLKKRFIQLQNRTNKTITRKISFLEFMNQLRYLPEVVILLHSKRTLHMLKEAASLAIPTIGLVELPRMTNIPSDWITYPVLVSDLRYLGPIYYHSLLLCLREVYVQRMHLLHSKQ